MNNTIAAKLTAVEAALKENVSKVVKSKVSGNKFRGGFKNALLSS
jgi:hypothetical protein